MKIENDFGSLELNRIPSEPLVLALSAVDKLSDGTHIILWFSQDDLRKFCEATLAELNYEHFSG